jgi:hypothetical protein
MVLHALPALHRTEITHKTIVAVAHASQSAIPEHDGSMHLPPIPSNLDRERLKNRFSNARCVRACSAQPRR